MKDLTDKKYLCVIRGKYDFITEDGTQYRGYYLVADDRLARLRNTLEDYAIESACIFKQGEKLASHVVNYNEAGDLVILRTWRGDIFRTTPPASIWVGNDMDNDFKEMLEIAREQVKDGLAYVYDV